MKKLNKEIIHFFQGQGCVIISTVDKNGLPHSSCKGLVKINANGRIYLLDLYRGKTHDNLRRNPHVSITAIDEHRFLGYCLKGKAKEISEKKLTPQIIRAWDEGITNRITRRVIKNIREEKGHHRHPEILLPKPEYLIVMDVEEVVDLTPHHLK